VFAAIIDISYHTERDGKERQGKKTGSDIRGEAEGKDRA
jgi:hypothetical protein